MKLPAGLRRDVILRARNRCEYCGLAQAGQEAQFHIDHVVPVADGGPTALDNLALACVPCSLRKGARRSIRDPQSGKLVPMFHPRRESWHNHFAWKGCRVVGTTASGRATVAALKLNRLLAVAIRAEEAERGRHPPPSEG